MAPEITPPGWINPRVTFLREHQIDISGPAGLPDRALDLVLEVILEPALLKEIETWEVHGNANLGHWTTASNKDGWWLIRTELDPDQSNGKRSRIRLCFPDNNNPAMSTLILRALRPNGAILFQQTISATAKRSAEEASGEAKANARVTFLREHQIDLTGPAGRPDGALDLVLEVILEPTLLKEIETWEVHGSENLGHWTTAPNKNGWWLIRTELDPDQSNGKESRIRLCFPDNNNPAMSTLILRALRPNGAILFQQAISK